MNTATMKLIFSAVILLGIALLTTGCGPRKAEVQSKHYTLRGTVISADPGTRQAIIQHEAIPGFMEAMTMGYTVHDDAALQKLKPGDVITAELVVRDDYRSWLQHVQIIGKAELPKTSGEFRVPAQGEVVPNFTLIGRGGHKVSLRQYRGQTVVLTFIYTRCPLPDYCPRMNSNFLAIEKELQQHPELYPKTHLITVSFDPEHDTPKVLDAYGKAWLVQAGTGAGRHWDFVTVAPKDLPAVAKFFGMEYFREEGSITHSLSTTVIGPDMKIVDWYSGSRWQPEQALKSIANASGNAGGAAPAASAY
jgi:protein SCO1/2